MKAPSFISNRLIMAKIHIIGNVFGNLTDAHRTFFYSYFRIYNKSYCKTKQRITNKEMKRKKETLTLDLKLFFEIIYSILIRFIKKAATSVKAMAR